MRNIISYLQLMWLMKSPPALFSRLFSFDWYRGMLEDWVAPFLQSEMNVLEVGCASGDFARMLSKRRLVISAVDRSSKMILNAKKIHSDVKYTQADSTNLPYPDHSFDLVLAASLINVVDSPLKVLNEMKRVCRNSGIVSILVPAQSFTDEDALRYVEVELLTGLSKAAFMTWHRLARKMDTKTLLNDFSKCGLTDISTRYLLNGMGCLYFR